MHKVKPYKCAACNMIVPDMKYCLCNYKMLIKQTPIKHIKVVKNYSAP